MQVNKGCSIEFLSARMILAVSIYKKKKWVYSINATFVTDFNKSLTTQLMRLDSDGK
jgi:hypothetical protein